MPKITVEEISRVVHEANRALQIVQGDPTIPVSPEWDELDEETKASAIDGVNFVLGGATAEQSHDNWCQFKMNNGWVWGEVKDEEKKEHPLLVPYSDLPEEQRLKDDLFGNIVRTFA